MRKRNIRSIEIYSDIAPVLDAVLARGAPATLTLNSQSEAHVWIHRANRMRVALRINDELRNGLVEGEGTCVYDPIYLQKRGNAVRISLREVRGTLQFDGDPEPAAHAQFDDEAFRLEDDE